MHADIPGSVEAYYQEIGRAGRDGLPASATLLWNYADVKTREFLIDRGRDEEPGRRGVAIDPAELERRKDLERKKLRRMVAYATTAGCLRATILHYFGDPAAHVPCGACGNCDGRAPLDDDHRLLIRKILSGIARAPVAYGRRKIAAMLVGDKEDLPPALTGLSTTGLLSSHDLNSVEHWIDSACSTGLISVTTDKYRTLSLTTLGREVMAGRVEDVRMNVPREFNAGGRGRRSRARTRKLSPSKGDQQPATRVVETLRAWRLAEARRRGIAPFVILHDRTLTAIATALPDSAETLADVPGIGPAKLAAYGESILTLIRSTQTDKVSETS